MRPSCFRSAYSRAGAPGFPGCGWGPRRPRTPRYVGKRTGVAWHRRWRRIGGGRGRGWQWTRGVGVKGSQISRSEAQPSLGHQAACAIVVVLSDHSHFGLACCGMPNIHHNTVGAGDFLFSRFREGPTSTAARYPRGTLHDELEAFLWLWFYGDLFDCKRELIQAAAFRLQFEL